MRWKKLKRWKRRLRRKYFMKRMRRYWRNLRNSDFLRWDRRQVALAVALGLLVAFIPIPLQFLYAGFLAGLLRINIPVTIAMTSINNPFTFLPLNYFIYRVGTWITDQKAGMMDFPEFHWNIGHLSTYAQELKEWFTVAGKSYGVGLLTVSMTASLIGYFSVELIWRFVEWDRKRIED